MALELFPSVLRNFELQQYRDGGERRGDIYWINICLTLKTDQTIFQLPWRPSGGERPEDFSGPKTRILCALPDLLVLHGLDDPLLPPLLGVLPPLLLF